MKEEIHRPKWLNIISIILFHVISVYSIYEVIFYSVNLWYCILCIVFVGFFTGLGVTAGVHRMWCHKSYKATTAFKIFISLCYSIAGQNTIYDWVRDHRIHHKNSDTDGDPHNASRGFWFSHVGWLFFTKHPEVIKEGKIIPMDDILTDPVAIWHTKYFIILKIFMCFILPTLLPVYLYGETLRIAILSQCFFRYCLSLNFTWLVNSAAHMWGNKPFNKNIKPSENKYVSMVALGEGWHNYHHVFPYDYKASELGTSINITTAFLNQCKKFGWIYDLREPTNECVKAFLKSNGDGSHKEM